MYPHLLEATRQNEKPQVMNLRDRMQVIKYTCRELTQRGLFRLRRRGRRHHRVPVAPWWVSAIWGVGPWPVWGAALGPVVRRRLLRVSGHGGGEDWHRSGLVLVWSSRQRPGVVLQGLLVREISGSIIVREVPVNVDILKHCLLTSQGVQQLKW